MGHAYRKPSYRATKRSIVVVRRFVAIIIIGLKIDPSCRARNVVAVMDHGWTYWFIPFSLEIIKKRARIHPLRLVCVY